jgi:aminocarboxymuconate-semialdehyde decarboxylase
MKIDMHTHLMPADFPDFAKKFGYGDFIRLEHHRPGFARMMKGDRFFREIEQNCWDAVLRIDEYAALGVDLQVICTIPVLFAYWTKPQDGLEVSRFLNDQIAEICARFPRNYLGLGTLPMQDNSLAIKELERCQELGMRGVQIGSNINQKNLSDPEFFPIFEAAQDLDMAILVHPWEMMGENDMAKYWLPWLVGMPAEMSRAACSLIFGGVLERLPRLRWCFAHAGGSFLPTLGRIEHGFHCRPDLVAVDNPINPRDYLGKFWVDSVTHDADLLEFVLKMVGPEKIMLGSDYPFPLGDLKMGQFIEKMNLPESTKQRIFRQNTLDWLGLESF